MFAVVTTEADGKSWRVAIYCDENVPLFGPSLPCPPVFEDPYNLREFLLVKLINGEKATFDTPTFSRKRERTLDALLRDMYQEHSQDSKSNVSYFTQTSTYSRLYFPCIPLIFTCNNLHRPLPLRKFNTGQFNTERQ